MVGSQRACGVSVVAALAAPRRWQGGVRSAPRDWRGKLRSCTGRMMSIERPDEPHTAAVIWLLMSGSEGKEFGVQVAPNLVQCKIGDVVCATCAAHRIGSPADVGGAVGKPPRVPVNVH